MARTGTNFRFAARVAFALCITAAAAGVSAEDTSVGKRQLDNDGGSAPLTLTFGIVPQQSASKLAKLWTPILSYIGKRSGYRLKFKTAKNIPTFEQRVSEGAYDLSYMNPYHYTVYHDKSGYEALAKAKDKRIKGIIVVRKDSELDSLEAFEGQQLAFPSPAAFAASILTRAEFQRRGISIEPKYVSSHDSVYRNVAAGRMSAGGGVIRTFKNVAPDVSEKLRVLWTTPGYTPHAIAAHPRVPQAVRQRIQQVMVDMDKDPEGKALLNSVKLKGLEIAENNDWDDVRNLGITILK